MRSGPVLISTLKICDFQGPTPSGSAHVYVRLNLLHSEYFTQGTLMVLKENTEKINNSKEDKIKKNDRKLISFNVRFYG